MAVLVRWRPLLKRAAGMLRLTNYSLFSKIVILLYFAVLGVSHIRFRYEPSKSQQEIALLDVVTFMRLFAGIEAEGRRGRGVKKPI